MFGRLASRLPYPPNASTLVLVTGNGLVLSEDLARRFLIVELDAGTENPEHRPFTGDLVSDMLANRGDLLAAVLTIWRWGRQNSANLTRGLPLGSFGPWCEWVRDPLLTLGCADPAERVAAIKANDPRRRAIAALFSTWWQQHGSTAVRVAELADTVRELADPRNRGRQYLAAAIRRYEGTRAAGFKLLRNAPPGHWTADTYQLIRTTVETEEESMGGIGGIGVHRDSKLYDPDVPR